MFQQAQTFKILQILLYYDGVVVFAFGPTTYLRFAMRFDAQKAVTEGVSLALQHSA